MRFPKIQSAGDTTNVDAAWDKLYAEASRTRDQRIVEYGAPDLKWASCQDIALVYRLPSKEKAKMHKGLIHIPEVAQTDEMPYSIGVLIWAGLEAMDVLESHGVLPGDLVKFARYAGEEEAAARAQEAVDQVHKRKGSEEEALAAAIAAREEEVERKKLLELQVPFIHGSLDLQKRLCGPEPTMRIVRRIAPQGRVFTIEPVVENLL